MDLPVPPPANVDSGRHDGPHAPWWSVLFVLLGIAGVFAWYLATEAPADQGGVVRSAWSEDYAQAVATSRATGRPILMNFTGSDWCGYCIRMRHEIFDTGIFASWAKERVVLLECDFPKLQRQSAATAAQNNQLAERYAVEGFPTIVILTAQGDELVRVGYKRGGAAAWITGIDESVRRGTTSVETP